MISLRVPTECGASIPIGFPLGCHIILHKRFEKERREFEIERERERERERQKERERAKY